MMRELTNEETIMNTLKTMIALANAARKGKTIRTDKDGTYIITVNS